MPPKNLGTFGGQGLGPLLDPSKLINQFGGPFSQFEKIMSTVIGVLTISAGIWFVFQIFAGAYQWLASGGEKQALQNAQKRISNAIIGLFVVVVSYGLILLLSGIFGIEILEPALIIQTYLKP